MSLGGTRPALNRTLLGRVSHPIECASERRASDPRSNRVVRRLQRNARFIQASSTTFYKGRLIRCTLDANGKRKPEPTARLLEVAEFVEKLARKGKTLVVTNKPVRCALTAEDEHGSLPISAKYRGADIAHFGNIRGSNDFEGHEIAIILGR